MSLCNTFRFFAVYATILLSVAGNPVPGFINDEENIATKEFKPDLENQESIAVELKNDIKRPNDIKNLELIHSKDDTNLIPLDVVGAMKNENKNSYESNTSKDEAKQKAKVIDVDHEEMTTLIPQKLVTETTDSTTILNLSLVTQLAEVFLNEASKDENKHTNSLNSSAIIGMNDSMKLDLKSENNDAFNENETEVGINDITKIKLNHITPVSLDIPESSTVNTDINTETSSLITDTEATNVKKSAKLMKSLSLISGITKPAWKKYTVIERSTTSDVPPSSIDSSTVDNTENVAYTLTEDQTTIIDKSEVMMKSESAQGRILLQDAITSDIPSLEKLKSDLLSFSKFSDKSDTESTTSLMSMEEGNTKSDTVTFKTTFPTTNESPNTVSSKRGGYLDLSVKNTTENYDIRLTLNSTLPRPLNVETPGVQTDSLDGSIDKKLKSQSEMAEDAIKEELSKKEMLNDTAEISKHRGAEGIQIETDRHSLLHTNKVNLTQLDDKFVQPLHIQSDENLNVRPINSDKVKNTILYPVNPNYKPLKKIEVQPAKPFVRDPDDNSWRNESLSSLGIVFKPKNSSKPFTQVLKNKTETEWNNLLEKDVKSEVPDLRVRLEQIAQKRKSKKKKIDSFGNVFYTDYEDNSSSEENTSTPKIKHPSLETFSTTDASTSGIAVVTHIETISVSTSSSIASSDAMDVPALTTTATPTEKIHTTPKKEPTKYTTLRPPKSFNLFDYYETNDEEDIADYLNMAKIDLKKYTVPIQTTYTPDTSPPLPILFTNPIPQYLSGRKGTIQYFPPRTTKRPKKTKQNIMHDKINPLTFTDTPKNVLPISYHKLTTPYDRNMYYTNRPDVGFKEDLVPKNYDRNLYLTTPPLTTVPDEDFGVIGDVGGYNRPNYVIKHYKDYTNEAVHEQDHSKLREFSFAEPAARDVPVTDFVKPTTMKDKTTVAEDYDYQSDFRKDLLDRFVANFNSKPSQLKSSLPVVYNNSIVHGMSYDEKDVALSRSYFRRPYSDQEYKPIVREQYDPNCENVTVELSPAYELHYYVPEQEEKQEVEAKPINSPVPYRL